MRSDEGDRLRDEGIDRSFSHADSIWKAHALRALHLVVVENDEFTTDAIWAYLDDWGVVPPREERAMGGVMTTGQSRKWCETTPRTQPSVRPVCHSREMRVWRSKVVGTRVPLTDPLDHKKMVAAIRTWPSDDQMWWRNLLEVAPSEAMIVGQLAMELDAKPL